KQVVFTPKKRAFSRSPVFAHIFLIYNHLHPFHSSSARSANLLFLKGQGEKGGKKGQKLLTSLPEISDIE
ncbi:hypothetical protein, partial [uncultured Parabacteroides sp.]|uniref:hypothetical protein n=1 Tax=uncultured Parabacteroides sp. TaxID=512312 RepID=UPI0025846DC3